LTPPNLLATSPVRSLADVHGRARAVVVSLRTDADVAERLHAVGLGVGTEVVVLRGGRRPTVRVGSSRLGLGPELARAVEVRVLAGPA
jgi:Fe2+ transport system protein FeoA